MISVTFLFVVVISGVTLFVGLNREELSSMHDGKMEMSLGVHDLGDPRAVDIVVSGVVSFVVLIGSMFDLFYCIELIHNP